MKYIKIIFFLFLIFENSYSQQNKNYYEEFITDLIHDNDNLDKYFSEEEIRKSGRLKINYEDVKFKFLISYNIDEELKERIIKNNLAYNISVNKLNDKFTEVNFSIEESNIRKSFYFRDDKLVFPSTYFSGVWRNIQSEYFNFFISDTLLFNQYCSVYLDKFVERTLESLKATEEEKELLRNQKILYIFCKDEDEIEKVCGFKTKGVYLLPEDAVVTTYNSHTHEVAHLLLNYKLKTLPLYTLPFIQEGFAVATGGRGGLGYNVLMDVGYYSLKTKFVDLNEILTKNGFQSEDPSITYPVCGLINQFIIEQQDMEGYLQIYRKLSGNLKFVLSLDADEIKSVLSLANIYEPLISHYKYSSGILFDVNEKMMNSIHKDEAEEISATPNFYSFKLNGPVLFSDKEPIQNYESRLFLELFPGRVYKGEKYFLNVNSKEIKLYNFYVNELISSFDTGFNTSKDKLPEFFFIDKIFLEGNLEAMTVTK